MNDLISKTKHYQRTDDYRSAIQVLNTFIPYFGLWYLITLSKHFLVTLGIATILALLSVRIFIILHDCGHQSFFTNKKIESIVGFVCGVFAFTSAKYWSYLHDLHHAFNGNLDRPYDYSDIYMMTKAEYWLF
jgi:omega-6 fatty acid desaturase (delta-12 desaturase)